MFTPSLLGPLLGELSIFAVIVPAYAWSWLLRHTRRGGLLDDPSLIVLGLITGPFALFYPGSIIIVVTCGIFFNWCGGSAPWRPTLLPIKVSTMLVREL
jgi:hypothetical protein